jgi:hypothetical protein
MVHAAPAHVAPFFVIAIAAPLLSVIASGNKAIQRLPFLKKPLRMLAGLLRRFAPRNDEEEQPQAPFAMTMLNR